MDGTPTGRELLESPSARQTLAVTDAASDRDEAEYPVLFRGVTWDDYEAMLRIRGERRFRITYDRGLMEGIKVP